MAKNYSPGVLSVLPLFYVGWSDSVLGPTERSLILEKINKMPHLSDEDRVLLAGWTDQSSPPDESTFRSWIHAIKDNSGILNDSKKRDLIKLGISMAETQAPNNKSLYNSEEVLHSLGELEHVLGQEEKLKSSILYQTIDPEVDINAGESDQNVSAEQLAKLLDGENADLKEQVKKLLCDPFFLNKDIREKEEYRNRVLAQCFEFAKQGLSRFPFPHDYGGENDPLSSTVVFETMAHGDLSLLVKFGVQFGLFGGAINLLGTERHHKKYLKDLISLDLPGCFAMTETGHGSNVKNLETTAIYKQESDTITIHSPTRSAGKEYIGNALHSSHAVVFAQLLVKGENQGVHAIVVQLRDKDHQLLPGIEVEDNGYKMGLNGVDNGRIWFDQVEVPRSDLLNKYGDIDEQGNYSSPIESTSRRFFTTLGALVAGRVSIALASNAASKNALTIAIRYALKRRQFSQSKNTPENLIMDYSSHQWRLFPKLAKTYALHYGLEVLRKMYADKLESGDMRKVESLAAGLKSVASWHARDTIQECREACGGKGYLSENGFSDLKADTDVFTTFEGDNNVLLQLVSKGLLTEFREQFQDGGYMSIIRHLSDRLSTSITEQNPYTIRNTSSEHLNDHDFHLQALEYRENKLLFSLANRMRNFIKRRLNPNTTHQLVQNHMITLAVASIENFCAKEFYKAVENIENQDEKKLMKRLCKLYCLHTIYDRRGWFLEQDYISGAKSKAIRKQIDSLCGKIRPDAKLFVDAFMIPEVLLRTEIL